jgi:2-iminobutanoate/2-iminopropanoate deaminase
MDKKVVSSARAPQAVGPYSQAIGIHGMLFVSGQIPIDPTTGALLPGDIREQTHQVMNNLRAILEEADQSLSDVVKTTIYLKDMGDFAVVNEAYGSFFPDTPPARACIEAARLPKETTIMVDCIAVSSKS